MKKNILPLGVQVILVPVGLLLALILVFVIGTKIGLAQVLTRRSNLTLLQKNEEILITKRDLLTNVAPDVGSQTNLAVAALPGKNPALLAISQIKKLVAANGVALTGIKVSVGEQADSKAAGVEISLDLMGPVGSILKLISEVKKIAPITQVSKAELSLTGTDVQAAIQVKAYWAPFPTKLPALTEPISALNVSEESLLSSLSDLTLPTFVSLAPVGPVENPHPFGE